MISYNEFVKGEPNGWKDNGNNKVLLVQNEDGNAWGISQSHSRPSEWDKEARQAIDPLWALLQTDLPNLDAVVMYVGSYGSEHLIRLAAAAGLTPDHAVFVLCDCNQAVKQRVIVSTGFVRARQIGCNCGGRREMLMIYDFILTSGSLTG